MGIDKNRKLIRTKGVKEKESSDVWDKTIIFS
jgi:hypothetical protein